MFLKLCNFCSGNMSNARCQHTVMMNRAKGKNWWGRIHHDSLFMSVLLVQSFNSLSSIYSPPFSLLSFFQHSPSHLMAFDLSFHFLSHNPPLVPPPPPAIRQIHFQGRSGSTLVWTVILACWTAAMLVCSEIAITTHIRRNMEGETKGERGRETTTERETYRWIKPD